MKQTPQSINDKKKQGVKITALTAYDYPFARILDEAGIDIVLVGDSLGMVVLGYESTLPVRVEDMLYHTRAVARAVRKALVVSDMPFGSYDSSRQCLKYAEHLVRAGAKAVKLEGGKKIEKQVSALLKKGIAVMGHVGMTPQSVNEFGGYKVQGKEKARAQEILADAILLDKLGVFSIVLECIPQALAREITAAVTCPTIGIGAGPACDGQILVLHDMLGFESSVHPRFVRRYAELEKEIKRAAKAYCDDVIAGNFPNQGESY
jgi:3-methyl-2-oxobutanoate hydroxymethyltransferase